MFELIQVSEQCYYLQSPSKIGIYKQDDKNIYLIDSGNDKRAGKRALKIAAENGWNIKGIINTHAHADHIGGNHVIQQETGCDIFVNGPDLAFVRHTFLNPSFILGGFPGKELFHKFFLAEESEPKYITDEAFPKELKVVPIGGHSMGMIAIIAPDGTAFVGDIVSSEFTLEKYAITYLFDIKSHLESLDTVKKLGAKCYIPSHADITDDLSQLIELNRQKIFEIASVITNLTKQAKSFDQILKGVFDNYNMAMNVEQNALISTGLRSYLTWLRNEGYLDIYFDNNVMYYKSKEKSE